MYQAVSGRISGFRRIVFIFLAAVALIAVSYPATAKPFAYVANLYSGTVSVFDTATNKIVATIPVGDPHGIAVHPNGKLVYVLHYGGDISVINVATNKIVDIIPVDTDGLAIAIHPAGTFLYIVSALNSILVVNIATKETVATLYLDTGPMAAIVVHPNGTRVYAVNSYSSAVSVINTATNKIVATIPIGFGVGGGPEDIVINPSGTRVYTAGGNSGVSIINTATNTVIGGLPGRGPAIAVHPNGTRIYKKDGDFYGNPFIAVINAATNTVISTIPIPRGEYSVRMAMHPSGARVYDVAYDVAGNGLVYAIDTAKAETDPNHAVVGTVPVGTYPSAIAVGPLPDRFANNDRRAVVLGAFYALRPSHDGGCDKTVKNGNNIYCVSNWNYLYDDLSAYSVVKVWYGCNSSLWRFAGDGSGCSWPTAPASFYFRSKPSAYGYYGGYGRGGQCKYFANLVLYRSGSDQRQLPNYVDMWGSNGIHMEKDLTKAVPGDVLSSDPNMPPHTAIVVEIKKDPATGKIVGLDVIDSNWIKDTVDANREVIGRHVLSILNIKGWLAIWKGVSYYNCRYDPTGMNKLCP